MAKTECTKYYRPVLKGYSAEKKCWFLYQPPCKCWNCAPCARVNMYQWAARIGDGYESYTARGIDRWMFITITSNAKLKTKAATLWVWPRSWAKLSARMRRNFEGIRYVLIPELHKDGRVHIHMIASGGMSTKWIKDNAPYCGLGYMGEADPILAKDNAVWYVVKYVSKTFDVPQWPRGFRRIRTSQQWPQSPEFSPDVSDIENWEYHSTYPSDGLEYLAEGLRERLKVAVKVVS